MIILTVFLLFMILLIYNCISFLNNDKDNIYYINRQRKCLLFMGLSLLVYFMCISFRCEASVTFQQAKNVFSYIQNNAGIHVILKLDKDNTINAYTTPYSIHVTTGMLKWCSNVSQIANILAHELSHFKNKHPTHIPNKRDELYADKQGYLWCKSIYKNCLGSLLHARKSFGNEGRDGVHPSWDFRIKQLRKL